MQLGFGGRSNLIGLSLQIDITDDPSDLVGGGFDIGKGQVPGGTRPNPNKTKPLLQRALDCEPNVSEEG